jgi:hypothetical protein
MGRHAERRKRRYRLIHHRTRSADETQGLCRVVDDALEVRPSNAASAARPLGAVSPRDRLMQLEVAARFMAPQLLDERELVALSGAVQERDPVTRCPAQHVIDHRSQRRNSRPAGDEEQPLRRRVLWKQERSQWTFEIDRAAWRRRGEVWTKGSVSFQRDQQFERVRFRGAIR